MASLSPSSSSSSTPIQTATDNERQSPTSIRAEYDSLSTQVQQLSNVLARRRADLALMRGEAATLAMSLESAKQQLDNALRTESEIRLDAPPSPTLSSLNNVSSSSSSNNNNNNNDSGANRASSGSGQSGDHKFFTNNSADFVADQGLIRALTGQLEVTKQSVIKSNAKKQQLILEIERLKQTVLNQHDQKQQHPQPVSPQQEQTEKNSNSNTSTSTNEKKLIQILQDGVSSQSSYRSEHARIWRDSTLPNVIMIDNNNDKDEKDYSLGVITERIFEGITCFTKTDEDQNNRPCSSPKPNDQQQQNMITIQLASTNQNELMKRLDEASRSEDIHSKFTVLSATAVSSLQDGAHQIHVIAPKLALERVEKLSLDSSRRSSGTFHAGPTSTLYNNIKEENLLSEQMSSVKLTPSVITASLPPPPKRHDKSSILSDDYFSTIMYNGVPARYHESNLKLVYSTENDGMSLRTLYNQSKNNLPTIIAIRDTHNRIFGCYATQSWKSSSTRYYGTGECFVFGESPSKNKLQIYKWTRNNSLFQFTSPSFLAIGGGSKSHFALWIDEDLFMGTTASCSTFNNPPLTSCPDQDQEDDEQSGNNEMEDNNKNESESETTTSQNLDQANEFEILILEVWGFATGTLT